MSLTPRRTARLFAAALALAGAVAPSARAEDLVELYDLALSANADLNLARSRFRVAQEAIPQARAELLPRFGLHVSRGKFQQRQTVRGQKVPELLYDNESEGIDFQQAIFRPALIAQYVRSKHVVAGSEADVNAARRQMASKLTETYLNALLSQDRVALVKQQSQRAKTELQAAESALTAGTGTRTAIDEARAEVERLNGDRIEAEQALAYALHSLAAAAGKDVTQVYSMALHRFDPAAFAPEPYETLMSRARTGNPELESLRQQLEAARAEEKMSWSAHLPTLDAVGQWGSELGSNPFFAENGYTAESISLQMRMPLFSGGGDLSRDREAAAKVAQAEDNLLRAQQELGLQVRQESTLLVSGASRIAALNTAAEAYEASIRSTHMGVKAGTRTLLDVLNVERQAYEVETSLVQQRYALLAAWARLQIAAGTPEREALERLNALLDTATAGSQPAPKTPADG